MIPLRDILPTSRRPYVTYTIIGINVAMWIVELGQGAEMRAFIETWGMTPARFFGDGGMQVWLTPLTSMFLHGGWMHIIGNMWFLWIFGDNVEDVLGHAGFAAFYVVGGLGAAFLQFVLTLGSGIPMVGASGAIASVLAGYMSFFPYARVQTVLILFIFIRIIEVPAFLFIFVWFGFQLLSGCSSIGMQGAGTAWWAHIGGFIVGFLIALSYKKWMLRRGRNLPGQRGGLFTFHMHHPRRRPPREDDLMPPRGGWHN
jgi:membrane associated rhomboid family serine protease